jgi:DNA-binding transcriptional MerR regulator
MKTSTTRRAPSPSARAAADRRETAPAQAAAKRLRMRDLVHATGLPRETIHFYRMQGLMPPPAETGRNTAVYTQEHVDRLLRIKELQDRHFLPLKAIRAVLDDSFDEDFTPEQEDLVRRVRGTLAGWASAQQKPSVPVADFVPERISRREFKELLDAGLVTARGRSGETRVSEDDAVILECWARFKELGLGPEQGVEPGDLRLYQEWMQHLVAREARLALRARAASAPEELSRIIELVGPVIGRLLGAMHRKQMRRFLAEFDGRSTPAGDD